MLSNREILEKEYNLALNNLLEFLKNSEININSVMELNAYLSELYQIGNNLRIETGEEDVIEKQITKINKFDFEAIKKLNQLINHYYELQYINQNNENKDDKSIIDENKFIIEKPELETLTILQKQGLDLVKAEYKTKLLELLNFLQNCEINETSLLKLVDLMLGARLVAAHIVLCSKKSKDFNIGSEQYSDALGDGIASLINSNPKIDIILSAIKFNELIELAYNIYDNESEDERLINVNGMHGLLMTELQIILAKQIGEGNINQTVVSQNRKKQILDEYLITPKIRKKTKTTLTNSFVSEYQGESEILISKTKNGLLAINFPTDKMRNDFLRMLGEPKNVVDRRIENTNHTYLCPSVYNQIVYFPLGKELGKTQILFPSDDMKNAFFKLLKDDQKPIFEISNTDNEIIVNEDVIAKNNVETNFKNIQLRTNIYKQAVNDITIEKVAAYGHEKAPLNLKSAEVELNCPPTILKSFRDLLRNSSILGCSFINPYNGQLEFIPKDPDQLTARHLQILARNEESNTTGEINTASYAGKLTRDQVSSLKCLVKGTNIGGIVFVNSVDDTNFSVIKFKNPNKAIVIDQAGLQWQQDFCNTGGMFFYPNDYNDDRLPQHYLAWQNEMFKSMYGNNRPVHPKGNVIDIQWNGVKGILDLNSVANAIATEFLQALDAVVAQSENLSNDEFINFKFFNTDKSIKQRLNLSGEKLYKFEQARLMGIFLALRCIEGLKPTERAAALNKIKRIELPLTGEPVLINGIHTKFDLTPIKNSIIMLLGENGWGGTPKEDIFTPIELPGEKWLSKKYYVNACNSGSVTSAMIGNNGKKYSTMDAKMSNHAYLDHLNPCHNTHIALRNSLETDIANYNVNQKNLILINQENKKSKKTSALSLFNNPTKQIKLKDYPDIPSNVVHSIVNIYIYPDRIKECAEIYIKINNHLSKLQRKGGYDKETKEWKNDKEGLCQLKYKVLMSTLKYMLGKESLDSLNRIISDNPQYMEKRNIVGASDTQILLERVLSLPRDDLQDNKKEFK